MQDYKIIETIKKTNQKKIHKVIKLKENKIYILKELYYSHMNQK